MKVVDMHCDTISALLDKKRKGECATLRENDCHVNLVKMKQGDYMLQNFALFVEMGRCEDPWQEVQELFETYMQEIAANADSIAPVFSYGDIERNMQAGKVSAMLTVEEGGVCGGDLEKLHTLYKQGVRMMTLLWNYPNELGWPNLDRLKEKKLRIAERGGNASVFNIVKQNYLNTPNTENGLTRTGIAFVEEMETMGMIIDVSHMSDAGFYDVLQYTRKPFVASHSNSRYVCPCVRNLSDDMIRKLAERGGVMGLNFCSDFLTQYPGGVNNRSSVADVVKHAKHIVAVGGVECLGLGSDFDGIETHAELTGADKLELLWDALNKNGFTQEQLDKIFGKNVLRVYKDILV